MILYWTVVINFKIFFIKIFIKYLLILLINIFIKRIYEIFNIIYLKYKCEYIYNIIEWSYLIKVMKR